MSGTLAALGDTTVKTILLCVIAAAAIRFTAQRSAAFRHDIWLSALACCALLPLSAFLFRLFPYSSTIAPLHTAAMAVAPMIPPGGDGRLFEAIDQIWSGDGGWLDFGPIEWVALAVWLAGALLAALRGFAAYVAARGVARLAMPFRQAAPHTQVPVLLSSVLTSPAVFGALRPVILLPTAAAGWPAQRLQAVLAHETAHVARRDCLTELVVQLASIVHWFNPLVHHAARAARAERERACDELVLANGFDSRAYAETLVEMARASVTKSPAAMLAMARPPELERRILALLASPRSGGHRRSARAHHLLPYLAALLVLPLAAATAPSAGALGPGSVQPAEGPLSGLDDPLSERVALSYEGLVDEALAVRTDGPEGSAIRALQSHLDRQSHGYGDLVRERAIWALTEVRNGSLFEPVSRHVADRDWRLRAYSAWALAAAGDRRATPLLIPMLRDPVWRVRAMASAALRELRDPRAARAMSEALADPAWQVRISAAHYIAELRDPALTPLLLPLRHDPHMGTRTIAAALLASD